MAESAQFSFLVAGPLIDFDIPPVLYGLPELSSPVVSGIGARSFVFTPEPAATELGASMLLDGEVLALLDDSDGRAVRLYQRSYEPLTYWLRWDLPGGCITTHLREEDGKEPWTKVLAAVHIDTSGPTPFLLLDKPIRPAVSSFPGYQEMALWLAREAGLSAQLIRPGFLPEGELVSTSEDGTTQFRLGGPIGIEVQLSCPSSIDGASLVDSIASSIVVSTS